MMKFIVVLSLLICADSTVVKNYDDGDHYVKMVVSWMRDSDQTFLISEPEVLKAKADFIVAKDGSGNFKTVMEAVAAVPDDRRSKFTIYVKSGIYQERIIIGNTKKNLTIIGDGQYKTIFSGSLNDIDGFSISESATLDINADGFVGRDLCIRNMAGPTKGQAVALRVSADEVVIYQCRIEGYQDSLLANRYRQFYRDCYITGTVDFICGDAMAVFQNCVIEARKPMKGQSNMITAQSRDKESEKSGFSFMNCNLTASSDLAPVKEDVQTFLGRPWKRYSRVVFMESFIDDFINPAGWDLWNGDLDRLNTLYYGEFKNRGPGANTSRRVKWKGYHVITDPNEAANFTVTKLIDGQLWLNSTGVPYEAGL